MTTIEAIVTRRHKRGEVEDVIEIPALAFACPLGMVAFDKYVWMVMDGDKVMVVVVLVAGSVLVACFMRGAYRDED